MDLDMPTRMLTNPFMMCKGTKGGERGEQHLGHQSGARVICKWNSVLLALFVTPIVSLYLTHCISLCALFIETRVDKVQTGNWEKTQGTIGTADAFILSRLAQQP